MFSSNLVIIVIDMSNIVIKYDLLQFLWLTSVVQTSINPNVVHFLPEHFKLRVSKWNS